MKTSLKITFLTLIILSLFLGGCEKEREITEKIYVPEIISMEIQPGLQQEFTVTGDVFAHQISRITSEIRGRVDSVLVKTGDIVSNAAPLMKLSSSAVDSSFNTAGSTLRNAQIGLESTKLSAEKSIEAARISLETAKTNLQNVIRQNKTLKVQAEEALKAAELSSSLGISSAETSVGNAIANVLPTVHTAFNAANKIIGVSGSYRYVDSGFRKYLGIADVNSLSDTERILEQVDQLIKSYTPSYDKALLLLINTEDALRKTLDTLNNSITGAEYTQSALIADTTSITSQLSIIQTSLNTLRSSKDVLENAIQESNGTSQSILNAKAAYNNTIEQLASSERNARQAVEAAENALENSMQSANLSKVSAQSSVTSAYGNYDQARISKDKLNIEAPFKGKVSGIDVKEGEEVNPGTLLITIEDDSILNLVAYLSSEDVRKVKIGDSVTINKNGESATIKSISPSADPITKKYKVELNHTSESLRPGEIIKLTFRTGKSVYNGDRIFVPLPALHILPDDIFVWKLEDRKTVKAPITVGDIVGDYVEVLDGLSIGNEIISEGGRLIENEGTQVNILNKPSPQIPDNQ